MGRFLYSLFYGVGHVMENDEQYRFAKENLSREQFEKLWRSCNRLRVIQVIPLILLTVFLICIFIFIPEEEKAAGYATQRETYLLFGLAFFVLFYTFWIVLSQFVGGGRLWVRYATWYRHCVDPIRELSELLKILDGKK